MSAPLIVLLLLLTIVQTPAPQVPDDLAVVKGHYATAAYEDALAHLAGLEASRVTPELEQFRALCLLALGRTREGEQAFERLVRQAPLYVIPEAEISPRMLAVFRDVRRRVLPVIARELFNRGKTSYDEKRYAVAATELRELMRLLGDPDAAADATTFSDLRQLADGFLRLAEAEQALATRLAEAPSPAPVPPPAPPAVEAAPAADPPRDGLLVTKIVVYSLADRDVIPPIELERFMPPWNPPAVMARFLEYRGELEIIVDERGRAQEARMVRPTIPSYDLTLLGATERWRFQPARRNGEPVKFRLTFEVVLAPRQ